MQAPDDAKCAALATDLGLTLAEARQLLLHGGGPCDAEPPAAVRIGGGAADAIERPLLRRLPSSEAEQLAQRLADRARDEVAFAGDDVAADASGPATCNLRVTAEAAAPLLGDPEWHNV
jgi:hypothetical protein